MPLRRWVVSAGVAVHDICQANYASEHTPGTSTVLLLLHLLVVVCKVAKLKTKTGNTRAMDCKVQCMQS